jgi:hypothetical protein
LFKVYADSLKDETFTCFKSLLACKKNFHIGIMLDHSYTHSSLSTKGVRALKGIDNERYNLLQTANERLAKDKKKQNVLNFYICNAEMVVRFYDSNSGYNDGYDHFNIFANNGNSKWRESERNSMLRDWYDVNGKTVFKNLEIGFDIFDKILVPCFVHGENKANKAKRVKKEDNDEAIDENDDEIEEIECDYDQDVEVSNDDDDNEQEETINEIKDEDDNCDNDDDDDDGDDDDDDNDEDYQPDQKRKRNKKDANKHDDEISYKSYEARKQEFKYSKDAKICNNLKNWVKKREQNVVTMGNSSGIDKLTTYGKYMLVMWPSKFESEIVDKFAKYAKMN